MRPGRARRQGRRYPSGRLVRISPDDMMEPARAQRLKRAALRAMDDPKAGGIGGLLYQAGLLDEAQIEAGTLFGLLARKLAVLTGLPLPTAKASSPERIGGTGSGREASDGLLARVKEDYAIAVDTLGRTRRAVERVFVLDTRPRDGEICLVREGTRALAALWLTGEGKSADSLRIRRYMAAGAKPTDRPDLRREWQ